MAISREAVFQVADTLTAQGQRPSVRVVRGTLGEGSPNEITAHLRAWRAQAQERELDAQAFGEMPPAVREALTKPVDALLARLWTTLQTLTAAERQAFQADYEKQAAALREEAQDQSSLAEDLAAEVERLKQALETERTQRASAEQIVQTQREELARLGERLEQQARQLAEQAQAQQTIQELQLENATLRERVDNADRRSIELREQVAALQERLGPPAGT